MTNEHINEWALHAYVDGELSAEQRAEVEALMARDPEAARKVADWKRQRELLKTAFDGVLDEPVPQQLAAALRERAGPSRLSPWLAMAAAVLLLLFGGLGGWFLKGETAPTAVADLGQQALEAHSVFAVEVRHPVEVPGTDKAHLQAWLSKRVGTAFTVPDLTEQGYALLGGRLLSGDEGPAAMLMYEDRSGQRLSDLQLDAIFLKKALHHKSLESQAVYTEPDRVKLNRAIDAALARAEKAEDSVALPPPDFLAYGFKDVDPLGLFSGPNPKLLRRN